MSFFLLDFVPKFLNPKPKMSILGRFWGSKKKASGFAPVLGKNFPLADPPPCGSPLGFPLSKFRQLQSNPPQGGGGHCEPLTRGLISSKVSEPWACILQVFWLLKHFNSESHHPMLLLESTEPLHAADGGRGFLDPNVFLRAGRITVETEEEGKHLWCSSCPIQQRCLHGPGMRTL